MTTQTGENGLISRTVRDVLEAFLSVDVGTQVLEEALHQEGLKAPPCDRAGLRRFIRGALQTALVRTVGPRFAECVLADLDGVTFLSSAPPALSETDDPSPPSSPAPARVSMVAPMPRREPYALARGGVRKIGQYPPASRPASDVGELREAGDRKAPSAPFSSAAYVFVATQDSQRVVSLCTWLDPHAAVIRVPSVARLLSELGEASDSRVVVLIDCEQPAFDPMDLAVVPLPDSVEVVLWGAGSVLPCEKRHPTMEPARWSTVSTGGRTQEVAARCVALLGSFA